MSSPPAHDIYKSLCETFSNRKSDEVLEIEILTPGQEPFLRDGPCIGITKAALVKAFVIARQEFTEYFVHRNIDGQKSLETITEIILLFDCEHVTACNFRKRLIHASKQRYAATTSEHDYNVLKELLERERNLMTSFLCSPLHRHTKSPTLWQHRLWVLTELINLKIQYSHTHQGSLDESESPDNFDDIFRELILEEFDVVCKSGKLHPRNYYAFSYMRQMYTLAAQSQQSSDTSLSLGLAMGMIDPMLKWCLSNPSDISGWMYLFFLLDPGDGNATPSYSSSKVSLEKEIIERRSLVIDRVINFAVHIVAWEGESLWAFIDLMIARFGASVLPTLAQSDDYQNIIISESGCTANPAPAPDRRWQRTRNNIRQIYSNQQ